MKNKLPNINSNNGHFIDGNPATGTLGTIVTAEWLNGVQERVQDVFEELRNVLLLGNLQPDGQRQNQVAEAIKAYCNNINLKVQSNTRNFDNYIPNSKKSNAIDSNSADTVATSVAVKTAHDKALEATTAVSNLDSVAYKVNKSAGYAGNATALMQENTVFSTTDGNLLELPPTAYKWGTGVSMSTYGGKALLYIAHSNSQVWAKGGYSEDYSQPWKRLDGADWVDVRGRPSSVTHYGFLDFDITDVMEADLNHITKPGLYGQRVSAGATLNRNYPIQEAGTLLVTPSAYGVQQEYTSYYTNQKYVRGKLDTVWQAWKRIDGLDKANRAGDTFTGTVSILESDWSGLNLHNLSGKYFRIETNPDHASHFASFIYRNATGANEAVIYVPKKIGTMALIEDFSYQKIGNFEIRKYPDGTMIQTCVHRNGGLDYNRLPNDTSDVITLVYPLAFIDMPAVNVMPQLSHPYFDDANGGLTTNDKSKRLGSPIGEANDGSIGLTIDNNRSQCQFNYVNGKVFLSEMTFHITAIGRWK